ncbi:MAG TPA: aminoglycoside phosphotransferase family protein [Gemmatimonadales bacterium]|nr:aminoglycoside phosphotransferase family protein [Gemmatimonadales bacterium]
MIAFAAERDLALRDPAVPGLAIVCDPDAFLAAVRRATLSDVRDARLRYLRYKVHTLCRASYRLDVEGEEVDLDVRACRPEDLPGLLAEDGAQWLAPSPLGLGRILLADHAVVITVFPNDLKLPTLRHLVDPDDRALVLQETLPDRPDLWDGTLHGLAYRPERRYVAEVRPGGSGRSAVLKAYTRRAYARSKHNTTAFASQGPLRLAGLLGYSDARRLIASEWLPGATLLASFATADLKRDVVAETGAALATLHQQQPKGLPAWTRENEVDAVADVAEEIGFVCPSLARRAELLAQRIAAELAGAPPLHTPMHGDFSAAQVLVAPGPGAAHRVAIIDLDGACCGDPVDDLGNLLAQAERQVLDGAQSAGWLEEFTATLLEGYRDASGRALPDRIRLYTAWSLFRKARLPFRTRAPAWQESTEALVERAETVALESGRRRHREPAGLRQ